LAMDNGIDHFVETSAKTGDKVVEAYQDVANQIHQKIIDRKFDLKDKNRGIKVNQSNSGLINLNMESEINQKKKKSSCC
jgi:hypothetical protein